MIPARSATSSASASRPVADKSLLAYQGENVEPGPEGPQPRRRRQAQAARPAGARDLRRSDHGLPMRSIFARADKLDKPIFEAIYSYPADIKVEHPQGSRSGRHRATVTPGRRSKLDAALRRRAVFPEQILRDRSIAGALAHVCANSGSSQSRRSCNKRPPHAQAHGYQVHPHHRGRTDRHRPGLRVRLFGNAGLQGLEGRGLPHHPRQFQSGDDHDGSGSGGRDLHRADHARDRRQDHRGGAPRRAAADHGRPDGAQHGAGARARRRPREVRRRDDRRPRRRHRHGRGPQAVPRGHGPHRAGKPARRHRVLAAHPRRRGPHRPLRHGDGHCRGDARARHRRPAGHHPPRLHARRHRRRRRLQPRRVRADRPLGHRRLAGRSDPHRREPARLERIRDGGRPRQGGQLHHRLLDRERRSDGRAHRRLASPSRRR